MTTSLSTRPQRRRLVAAGLMLTVALVTACASAPTLTLSPVTTPATLVTPMVVTPPAATPAATGAAAKPTDGPAVPTPARATPTALAAAPAKLNLNTATAEQFRAIPGVGDRMVREFEEYRPYTSITQFRREIGKYVAAEQVAAYERYVFVPIAPNAADVATLQQLPGLDAALAAQLIAGRPYASTDAFLTRLAQLVPSEQAAAARAYLATA